MKKLFVVAFIALMSTSAFAAKYGAAGCGLGSIVFQGDQTWWKQVLAATTNGTSGTQTFGITFGTSNCDSPTPFKLTSAQAYVEANRIALANDIARGNGETIVGLSKVFGCEDTAHFGKALKSNYNMIFSTTDATSVEITNNISNVAASSCNTKI